MKLTFLVGRESAFCFFNCWGSDGAGEEFSESGTASLRLTGRLRGAGLSIVEISRDRRLRSGRGY